MKGPVLITGGAGSVGRRLADRFTQAGRSVRVLDLPVMDFSGLEGRDGVEAIKGDVTDEEAVARSVAGVAAVVHLAALLPPQSERDRGRTFAVNVRGTRSIVATLERAAPSATLVFASSVSTYGDTSAESPPHPGQPSPARN